MAMVMATMRVRATGASVSDGNEGDGDSENVGDGNSHEGGG